MYFSDLIPSILEPSDRLRIANQILTVLAAHSGPLKNFRALDIGCSSGIITNALTPHFKSIVGIDIDKHALTHSPHFLYMSADNLKFKNNSFDIVICNQVYYWLPNAAKLFSEIYRVLKPGGVCFFAAVNKYVLLEPQYRKPLISILPRRLALLIEPRYACHYLSYWQLQEVCRRFRIHHYTPLILANPQKYHFVQLYKIPRLLRLAIPEPLSPNLIWLLEKPSPKNSPRLSSR